MLQSRYAFMALALAGSLSGCGDKPAPAPAPAPAESPATTSEPGLRLLTSRDDAGAPPAAPAPSGEAELPPGHPPIGDSGAGGMPPSHGTGPGPAAGPIDPMQKIAGTIDVAAGVKGQISGGALFVIARNAGSRQIVAVRRLEQQEFPLSFELTAADLMMQGTAFEGPFDVTARWSKSGDAMPGPGDIEGMTPGVAVGAKGVKIKLSDVRR